MQAFTFEYQNLLTIFAAGNFKPLLLKAMLRLKHGKIKIFKDVFNTGKKAGIFCPVWQR